MDKRDNSLSRVLTAGRALWKILYHKENEEIIMMNLKDYIVKYFYRQYNDKSKF